jgi:hypothetical protein
MPSATGNKRIPIKGWIVLDGFLYKCSPEIIKHADPPFACYPTKQQSWNHFCNPKIQSACPSIIEQKDIVPVPSSLFVCVDVFVMICVGKECQWQIPLPYSMYGAMYNVQAKSPGEENYKIDHANT